MISLLAAPPFARAESRPIQRLPKDLVRWSTCWMAIPEQMINVGVEYGPLAAVTWGPAKGAADMIEATTREVFEASKPDKHAVTRRDESRPKGPMFRYTF